MQKTANSSFHKTIFVLLGIFLLAIFGVILTSSGRLQGAANNVFVAQSATIPSWAEDRVLTNGDQLEFNLDFDSHYVKIVRFSLAGGYQVTAVPGGIKVTGEIAAHEKLFEDSAPFKSPSQDAKITVEAEINQDSSKDSLKLTDQWGIDLGKLNAGKLKMNSVTTEEAELQIDHQGLYIKAAAENDDNASFYAGAHYDDGFIIEASFRGEALDWFINISEHFDKSFTLFGVKLKSKGEKAALHLSPTGIAVDATFYTGASHVDISGHIDSTGVDVSGDLVAKLPLSKAGEIIDVVTDGAVCGYEEVRDGAICGYDTVTDAIKCGTDTVTDSVKCGKKTITDAERCGKKYVTDAAACGKRTVTSGAKCGWDSVSCWLNPLKWGKCKEPKSCKVAKSCNVAKSCKVAATCEVAKTCEDKDSPKSCRDLNKPKTCKRHHLGDKIGDLEGDVTLDISQKGLEVSFAGKYCPPSGCVGFSEKGEYHVGPPMQLCYDVSVFKGFENSEGKACTNF